MVFFNGFFWPRGTLNMPNPMLWMIAMMHRRTSKKWQETIREKRISEDF
jgi:hypothetical protein